MKKAFTIMFFGGIALFALLGIVVPFLLTVDDTLCVLGGVAIVLVLIYGAGMFILSHLNKIKDMFS